MEYIKFKNIDFVDVRQPEVTKSFSKSGWVEFHSVLAEEYAPTLEIGIPIGFEVAAEALLQTIESVDQNKFYDIEKFVGRFISKKD